MLKFVDVAQRMPEKRDRRARAPTSTRSTASTIRRAAAEQAGRCSQCGMPFCQVHCPLHNNIPDWLMLTAEGRLEEAYEVSQATNNFPEICGRICPQDRLCEGNCVIEQAGHGTVTIGTVEKYITDTAWERGWVKPVGRRASWSSRSASSAPGPAGLAAAEQLRRAATRSRLRPLRPGRRAADLRHSELQAGEGRGRAARRADRGGRRRFHLNVEVGRDASLEELRERHDAVLIATGVYKARDIKVPGVGLDNVVPAMDYLTASNRKGLGDAVPAFDDGTLERRRQATSS